MSLFSLFKGWEGELSTQFALWMRLDSEIYRRFHNLIIQAENGTTQIDHVVLSKYGIFVIETKNYEGWIYGGEKQRTWTQNLFGRKHSFQNPLHQNYKHTRSLAERLQIEHSKFHSLVFFIGDDVELKSSLPPNVMTSGLSAYIKSFTQVLFSDSELERLHQRLERLKDSPATSAREHVQNLKDRYSNNVTCPKCGGQLVERTAKKGHSAGERFMGCKNFPRCTYIKR